MLYLYAEDCKGGCYDYASRINAELSGTERSKILTWASITNDKKRSDWFDKCKIVLILRYDRLFKKNRVTLLREGLTFRDTQFATLGIEFHLT